jgi:hypothetical protein
MIKHYLYVGGSGFAAGLAVFISINFTGTRSAVFGIAASIFASVIFAITANMTRENGR